MRSVEELINDLQFVAKYERKREYNEINVGQLLEDAVIRVQSLLKDLEDVSYRYRECAADAMELHNLVAMLIHYVPRECGTCKHWVSGDKTPRTCEVGGCEDIRNLENWEWGYRRNANTLFSKLSLSPENMADFLVDRTVVPPCDVICGDVCTAMGNFRENGRTQCKKKIVDFLNQSADDIKLMDKAESKNKVCLTQAQRDTPVACLEQGRINRLEKNGDDYAHVGQERNLNE